MQMVLHGVASPKTWGPGKDRGDKGVDTGGEAKESEGPKVDIGNGEETRRIKNSAVGVEVHGHGAFVHLVGGEGNCIRFVLGRSRKCTLGFLVRCEPGGNA
ncbi:hypothetical protein LIER_16567 [Lithospermum erythrorhizon]|uniref:Uncharacterized protein n=1 Tax=Lithospermum erythrorhizon TaxID=34254 RepID=A0AAV3Q9R9_LITER